MTKTDPDLPQAALAWAKPRTEASSPIPTRGFSYPAPVVKTPMFTDSYPDDFPQSAREHVYAASFHATEEFDKGKPSVRYEHDSKPLALTWIRRIFAEFTKQGHMLGMQKVWKPDRFETESLKVFDELARMAHLSGNGRFDRTDIEGSDEWGEFRRQLGEVVKAHEVATGAENNGAEQPAAAPPLPLPAQSQSAGQPAETAEANRQQSADSPLMQARRGGNRTPDLETSRERVALYEQLKRDLSTVQLWRNKNRRSPAFDLASLKQAYPDLVLWQHLEAPAEQRELLKDTFNTGTYAWNIVRRVFGLSGEITSRAVLKKDRAKIRDAENGK